MGENGEKGNDFTATSTYFRKSISFYRIIEEKNGNSKVMRDKKPQLLKTFPICNRFFFTRHASNVATSSSPSSSLIHSFECFTHTHAHVHTHISKAI